MSANAAAPSLDKLFESAQRAHAVVSLVIDAYTTPNCDDEIVYSLWAVEREIREIKEGLDGLNFDESGGGKQSA